MSSSEEKESKAAGRWTRIEHEKFMMGLQLYGKNWKKIQEIVGTRNGSQIRSHAQKFFIRAHNNKKQIARKSDSEQSIKRPAVISTSIQQSPTFENDHSFFMNHIIKSTENMHLADFWTSFIDMKPRGHELESGQRKDSFVTFQSDDSKQNIHEAELSV